MTHYRQKEYQNTQWSTSQSQLPYKTWKNGWKLKFFIASSSFPSTMKKSQFTPRMDQVSPQETLQVGKRAIRTFHNHSFESFHCNSFFKLKRLFYAQLHYPDIVQYPSRSSNSYQASQDNFFLFEKYCCGIIPGSLRFLLRDHNKTEQ